MGPEFQNLTLADRLQVPSFKTRETRPARRPSNSSEFLSFPTSFSAWFDGFQRPKESDLAKIHQIWRFSMRFGGNLTKFDEIVTRSGKSLWILDGSDEISPLFGVFQWFPSVFGFTWNRCPPDEKPIHETRPFYVSVASWEAVHLIYY